MPWQSAKSMHTAWAQVHPPKATDTTLAAHFNQRLTEVDHGSSHESQAVAAFISTKQLADLRLENHVALASAIFWKTHVGALTQYQLRPSTQKARDQLPTLD